MMTSLPNVCRVSRSSAETEADSRCNCSIYCQTVQMCSERILLHQSWRNEGSMRVTRFRISVYDRSFWSAWFSVGWRSTCRLPRPSAASVVAVQTRSFVWICCTASAVSLLMVVTGLQWSRHQLLTLSTALLCYSAACRWHLVLMALLVSSEIALILSCPRSHHACSYYISDMCRRGVPHQSALRPVLGIFLSYIADLISVIETHGLSPLCVCWRRSSVRLMYIDCCWQICV